MSPAAINLAQTLCPYYAGFPQENNLVYIYYNLFALYWSLDLSRGGGKCCNFNAIEYCHCDQKKIVLPCASFKRNGMVSCCLTSLDTEHKVPWIPLLRLWECPVFFLTSFFTHILNNNYFIVQIHCSCGSYFPSCAICYQLWLWLFQDDLFSGTINEQYYVVILSLISCLCGCKYWWTGLRLNFFLVFGWALDRGGCMAGFLWLMFTST